MSKCKKCGCEIKGYPAISRDGKYKLCSRCGNINAMEVVGMPKEEIDKVMHKIDSIEKTIKK